MSSTENLFNPFKKFAWAAAFVALLGIVDAVYLTIHHYTAEPVPCTILTGCEVVLTSAYATLPGILTMVFGSEPNSVPAIPLALFGAAAYLVAFLFAILTALGKRAAWTLFMLHTAIMAAFTVWLLYLQAMVIGAFCQFCLISALVTFTLFTIGLVSFLMNRRKSA